MRILIVAAFLALSSLVLAQSDRTSPAPRNVELCELIRHPQKYDGHTIRVRSRVIFEFEDFSLDSSSCKTTSAPTTEAGIWLTFGGDQAEIATFCCGSMHREKGADIEVVGHRVGLVRDADFRAFFNQISARRLRRPDGKDCYEQCKFYQVTATLTGLFAAAKGHSGYGHFGMFHLLVIQQVEQVSAERTVVPFGGTFQCDEQKWIPQSEIMGDVADSLKCAFDRDCEAQQRFGLVAAHWKETVDSGFQTEAYSDSNGDSVANWISADLLTGYFTRVRADRSVSVIRERCFLPDADRMSSSKVTSIACHEYIRGLDDEAEVESIVARGDFATGWARTANRVKGLFAEGDQSWRVGDAKSAAWHLLQLQTPQWHLVLDPSLQFDKCQDASTDESPTFMGCNWYSPDGTQTFSVNLFKLRQPSSGEPERVPWLVTRVDSEVCDAVSE